VLVVGGRGEQISIWFLNFESLKDILVFHDSYIWPIKAFRPGPKIDELKEVAVLTIRFFVYSLNTEVTCAYH
jgi:hypothetical protein